MVLEFDDCGVMNQFFLVRAGLAVRASRSKSSPASEPLPISSIAAAAAKLSVPPFTRRWGREDDVRGFAERNGPPRTRFFARKRNHFLGGHIPPLACRMGLALAAPHMSKVALAHSAWSEHHLGGHRVQDLA